MAKFVRIFEILSLFLNKLSLILIVLIKVSCSVHGYWVDAIIEMSLSFVSVFRIVIQRSQAMILCLFLSGEC